MDTANIFTEDNGINRIKTWLVGASDGQTYPILDHYLKLIDNPAIVYFSPTEKDKKMGVDLYVYELGNIEGFLDEIIGYKHDYKIDDPNLETVATSIDFGLTLLIHKINSNPGDYFDKIFTAKKQFYWEAISDDGAFHDKSFKDFDTQEECYNDMMSHAVDKMKWNITYDDVTEDVEIRKNNEGVEFTDDGSVGYELYCYPDKIIHKSYSGKYTYEIHTR